VRFELTTSCTRNKRATGLRYAPTPLILLRESLIFVFRNLRFLYRCSILFV
jgi:hypothetical protein